MRKISLMVISLLSAVILITGCSTTNYHYTGRKNHLVKDIPAERCNIWEMHADWHRIANMTDEEICKAINCPEKVVTKEVPVYSTVTTVVTKEVPGPERIVTKEVPVEKEVKKPFFVLPGVFFDTDKSEIKPAGKKELDKAVKALQSAGFPAIIVSGHTDSVGTDEYNQGLSERRAASVKDYLASKGVPADKITTKGYGETKPIASNETASGRAQNRRVEIDLANP